MALVKVGHFSSSRPIWSERDQRVPRYKIPDRLTLLHINYDNLIKICSIDENNPQSENKHSSAESHQMFMESYPSIFICDKQSRRKPSQSATLRLHKGVAKTRSDASRSSKAEILQHPISEKISDHHTKDKIQCDVSSYHDVGGHIALIHKKRRIKIDPKIVREKNIAALRRLLQKLPFERSREDNATIYGILKSFSTLADQVRPQILKNLSTVAQLDLWEEQDITIFGNSGFYMILAGRVKASRPFVRLVDEEIEVRSPTPELYDDPPILSVGDCFGTFEPIKGKSENSRILSVSTLDKNSEFLLITASDYARITEDLRLKEENRKLSVLQSCCNYKHWARQSLLILTGVLKWVRYIPGTVLVKEGSRAPYMVIIKSGECNVLRKIETVVTLPNLKQESRTRDVLMGKLSQFESFGELSILLDEPMSCSIVTSNAVELAVIYSRDLKGLDAVTKQLIQQSCGRTFDHIAKDDVDNEYVNRKLDNQWNSFKKSVLQDVFTSRGITPGVGKWTK